MVYCVHADEVVYTAAD